MKLTVGFSKPKKWSPYAWLIMTAYGIPYDHVYIKFHSDEYDRDIIYQASGLAVNFVSPPIFLANHVVIEEFEIEIPDASWVPLMQFCIDNDGKPYGMFAAVGLGVVWIAALFGKRIKNPFSATGSAYVCSTLAGYILDEFAGAKIPDYPDNITPKEVFNYMLSLKS